MERPSLLLVDPDPRSTRVLEVALRKAGYAVKVTSTGAEALAEATRALPALLLAETVLPAVDGEAALDGFELCRRVQALAGGGGVPFIFLTSSSAVEDKVRGLQLGVEDYLTKPIYIKELLTRVQLVFSRLQRSGLQSSTARHGFTGELADMGLVDLLTTLDLGRKSGTLALSGPFGKAQARFRDGRVLDARAGSLRGERALYRMLGWTEGRFEVHFGAVDEGEVTLDASTQVLLLEGVRRLDEWQHLQESLPPLTLPFDPVPRQSQEVPMEADPILRHLDGTRSALEALEASGLGDLEALTIFSRLYHQGLVQARRLSLGLGDSLPEILSGPTEPEGLSPTELQVPSDQPPPPEEELERVLDGMTAAFRSNHKTVEASQEGAGSPHPTPPTPLGSDPESTGPAQEQDVAKHRGKRGKSKRESMAPGVATASNAAIETEEPVAQTDPPTSMVAPRTEALSAPPDKTVRVEGNVIHFPKLTPEPAEAPPRVGQVTLPAGSMAPEEPGRDSSPPAEPGPHASTAPPGSTPSEPAPAFSEPEAARAEGAPAEKAPEAEAKPTPATRVSVDEKAPDKARATDDRKDSVNRKREDLKRDRKESLSTHLSDEARAFFSDEAYEKAYKNEHDSFEDLHPTPEHPHEAAHSRRWMTLTGTLLFGIIAILAGGYIYTQTAVPETVVDTHRIHVSDNIPPPGEIVPPVVTSPGGSAANAGGSTPPAATPTATPEATPGAATAPAAPGTEPAATGPAPTPGTEPAATAPPVATAPATAPAPATTPEPTAPTGTAPAVAPPAPPAPAATTPAPAPSGQTPAQLLAAARAFRGPLAGRIAAYNTYFDAAPTDTRTMLALAMQMAEGSHFPEAEALATRATAAQPTSGQGWFILAFARKHQNNREGTAEARRRCTALGGQWANECRAL